MEKSNIGPIIILKMGGAAARDQAILTTVLADILSLSEEYRWILLHGGGEQVSSISRQYGIEPRFTNGIRHTSPAEMDIIDMGLAGLMNTAILRSALVLGLKAVGLSGVDAGLFMAEKLGQDNHTGRITSVNPEILHYLLAAGYLPIMSSVSSNAQGGGVNVNADDAALALAATLVPEKLIFISDIEGVLGPPSASNGSRKIIPSLNRKMATKMIQTGIISDGMIPKVENALGSVRDGTGEVLIGNVVKTGDLNSILQRHRGTQIVQ